MCEKWTKNVDLNIECIYFQNMPIGQSFKSRSFMEHCARLTSENWREKQTHITLTCVLGAKYNQQVMAQMLTSCDHMLLSNRKPPVIQSLNLKRKLIYIHQNQF